MTEQQKTDNNILFAKTRDLTMKNIRYRTQESGKFFVLYSPPWFNPLKGEYERRFDHEIAKTWDSLVHNETNGMLEGKRVLHAELLEGGSWVSDLKHVRNPTVIDTFDGASFRKRVPPPPEPTVSTDVDVESIMDVPDLDDDEIDSRPELPAIARPMSEQDENTIRDALAEIEGTQIGLGGVASKPKRSRKKKDLDSPQST